MHAWTHRKGDVVRRFAHFHLPTHVLCWLRGHRARVEVQESRFDDGWVLIECRVCGLRYSGHPDLHPKTPEEAKEIAAGKLAFARRAPEEMARNCDGRDGYGHREVDLTLEVAPRRHFTQGFTLRIGDRWSETPFDASVHILRWSLYFNLGGYGNRTAHRLTKGKKAHLRLGARLKEAS